MNSDIVKKYKNTLISAIITSIVLLVSLAWNDVIKTIAEEYIIITDDNSILSKLYYALFITFFVIILQIYLFPQIN